MALMAKKQQPTTDTLEFTGLPTTAKQKVRLPKTEHEQAIADENKRRQLDAILREQHQKIMDRVEKLNKAEAGAVAGQLQRFVLHN